MLYKNSVTFFPRASFLRKIRRDFISLAHITNLSLASTIGKDNEVFHVVTDERNPDISLLLHLFSNAASRIDCCINQLLTSDSSYTRMLADYLSRIEKRTIKVRVVTNIRKANVDICRKLMKHSELYHMDGIAGTFCIIDESTYLCFIEGALPNQEGSYRLLHSSSPSFVKMQQYLFENLVGHAVAAKEKLKEMAKSAQSEYLDTIQNPREVLKVMKDLISSATFEVLVIFSTVNSFYRAEKSQILDLLDETRDRGASVKVLAKADNEEDKEAIRKILKKHEGINVNFVSRSFKNQSAMFLVDQTFSLEIQARNDTSRDPIEALGEATHSNSETALFAQYSMFENLWIQAEIERQNGIRQAYFQIFKGAKLKDEVYERKWSLEDERPGGSEQ